MSVKKLEKQFKKLHPHKTELNILSLLTEMCMSDITKYVQKLGMDWLKNENHVQHSKTK